MIDQLRARFLPRFLEMATKRVQRAQMLFEPKTREPNKLAMELHALAGEAAMLELVELAQLARASEACVSGIADGEPGAEDRFEQSLRRLSDAVAALNTTK